MLQFIEKTNEYATFEKVVPAPYFRRRFFVDKEIQSAKLKITGLGFYEAHLNGEDITKGILAPYRSNLNDYIYYDEYDLTDRLCLGDNVLACIVGNGWQNPMGGYIWDFEKASWRGSAKLAFCIDIVYQNGTKEQIESDDNVKTADSPIVFNDLHYGEYYDARLELPGWDQPDYDDSKWEWAKKTGRPGGEFRLCQAEPIVAHGELQPISIEAFEDGYIYDFGYNNAGLCRMTIDGVEGQKILLQHFETLVHGKPYFENFRYYPEQRFQEDEYTCSGIGTEVHMQRFTYHGFRYVYVTGITKEQATKQLLTFVLYHSDIKKRGDFVCNDEVANKIQEATLRADVSNFHYFPTDCPQREKNGWAGDVSHSTEQLMLNFTSENSLREWARSLYKALDDNGQLPGIVPTGGWGYLDENGHPWNGPAHDRVLVCIPYFIQKYRGDLTVSKEAAISIIRYITYLYSMLNEKDLLAIGLGDWCQPNRKNEADYTTPLEVTDSMLAVDITEKAMAIFDALGMQEQKKYTESLNVRLRRAIRLHLIDYENCTVHGNTQTGQAQALAYGFFEGEQKEKAVGQLLTLVRNNGNFMDTGIVGGNVLFRVLAENGHADLAYYMITRPEHPSYGNWIARGATTLWEAFWKEETGKILSMNHHFWGDVSAWFYTYLAGMRINSTAMDIRDVCIKPCFIDAINMVSAYHDLPDGKLLVKWERKDSKIRLEVTAPIKTNLRLELPFEYICTKVEDKKEKKWIVESV